MNVNLTKEAALGTLAMIKLTLSMQDESGKWRVSAPNGHYRECYTCDLATTVACVVKDFAEWLVQRTNLDHLVITVARS